MIARRLKNARERDRALGRIRLRAGQRRPERTFKDLRSILDCRAPAPRAPPRQLERLRRRVLQHSDRARRARAVEPARESALAIARSRTRQLLRPRGRREPQLRQQRPTGRRPATSGSAAASCGAGRRRRASPPRAPRTRRARGRPGAPDGRRDEVTLGGGTKAERRRHRRAIRASRPPAAEHAEPAVTPCRPASATMRSATSRWNISVRLSKNGGHVARAEPADEQRRARCCRAGWRRSCVGPSASAAKSIVERIALDDRRAAPDSARRSPRAPGRQRASRSMAITFRAPAASSARVSPPGPGPTSIDRDAGQRPGGARDPAVRLRSSRKFWPSALARR